MKLSLIVRGQHPATDDIRERLADDLELVRRAEELGFDGIVKGSHYSAHPFQSVQQVPFLAQVAAIAPKLRLICGLVLLPLHKPLDLAEQLATLDIMSNGKLGDGDRPLVVYSEECHPVGNPDWFDYKRRHFGGDDSIEFIEAERFIPLINRDFRYTHLRVQLSETDISLSLIIR